MLRSAIDPWYWIEYYLHKYPSEDLEHVTVEELFPNEIKWLLERGLERTSELTGLFPSSSKTGERTRMMIYNLGLQGDETSVDLLAQWAESNDFGTDAIKAIREIRTSRRGNSEC